MQPIKNLKMKKIIIGSLLIFTATSCDKVEETITTIVTETKEKAQQKTQEVLQETVNEQLNKIVNAETLTFQIVFPHENSLTLENESGRKVAFPNGAPFYIFKYKVSDKDLLLKTLIEQPTTDEAKSKKEFEVINYLINPPSYEDLANILEKLNFNPIDLVRKKEQIWLDNFKDLTMNNQQIIQAMITHPILIERPIVIKGNKAIIGRDLENVAAFIS